MSTTLDQPMTALSSAQARRMRLTTLRRDLRAGRVSLTDLMLDPPADMENVILSDVLRWLGCGGSSSRIRSLGKWAVRDSVNLLQTVGEASAFSRAWVAENGLHGLQKGRWAA